MVGVRIHSAGREAFSVPGWDVPKIECVIDHKVYPARAHATVAAATHGHSKNVGLRRCGCRSHTSQ